MTIHPKIIVLFLTLLLPSTSYGIIGTKGCNELFGYKPYINKGIENNMLKLAQLPSYIDHTLLKPEAKKEDLKTLVKEAVDHGFKAICINSCSIPYVKNILKEEAPRQDPNKQQPLIATVIGFPLGATNTSIKVHEAIEAYENGANELDMVINVGYLKDKDFKAVESDINQVVKATPLPVKVILETGLLTKEEIVIASKIVEAAQAHFVKTSTGFSKGGALVEDIKLIKKSISSDMKIKASGGIRDLKTALKMLDAGAHRLGLSSSVSIIESRNKIVNDLLSE